MNDFPYTFDDRNFYNGPGYRAGRHALLSVGRPSNVPDPTSVDVYTTLLTRWRQRLLFLKTAKWAVVSTSRALVYARNCVPFGVELTSGTDVGRPCHRLRVCPWCYAREVVYEAYRSIEYAVYGDGPEKRLNGALYSVVRAWTYPKDVDPGNLIDAATKSRWDDLNQAFTSSIGGLVVLTLSPDKDGIRLRRSTIGMVSGKKDFKPETGAAYAACETLTKSNIASLVSRVLPYPAGLMFGDAGLTVSILNACAGRSRPIVSAAGFFKNRSRRKSNTKESQHGKEVHSPDAGGDRSSQEGEGMASPDGVDS